MADNRLELFIETLTGTAFELQVTPLETVMSIKAKIQHLEGIPVSQQHLIWRQQELANDFSLQDYSIRDGSTLKLVLGMQGGPINTRKAEPKNTNYMMAELMEAEGEDVFDGNRPLTVVVLHDGDKVHWYTVIEESESNEASRCTSCNSEAETIEREPSPTRLLENQIMKQKIEILQKQLRAMGINKKAKRKKPSIFAPTGKTGPSSSHHQEQQQGFLPMLPQGAIVNENIPISMGRTAAKGKYKPFYNNNGPTEEEKSSPLQYKERLPNIADNFYNNKTEKIFNAQSRDENRMSSRFAHNEGPIASSSPIRNSVTGRLSRSMSESNPIAEPLATECHCSHARKPLRIKDTFNFSSVAGTPTTSHRLAEIDKWIQNRPKTTPSKLLVYCPIEGISALHGFRKQHHAQHRNNIRRSVREVGSGNFSPIGPGPGGIVAGGITRIKSGRKSGGKNHEDTAATKLPVVIKKEPRKKGKRCSWCNKKTGLASSYICRCGKNYCASHRYPELHHCSHDFKTEGRRLLQLSNPVIAASKLPKI